MVSKCAGVFLWSGAMSNVLFLLDEISESMGVHLEWLHSCCISPHDHFFRSVYNVPCQD